MYYGDKFEFAIEIVFAHEGGYVNDPVDPGGATNFGCSFRWLKNAGKLDLDGDGWMDGDIDRDGDVDVMDIRKMKKKDAKKLYFYHWWDNQRYEEFDISVGTKIFDTAINMGRRQAYKIAQRACNDLGSSLKVDGVMGPNTRAAINSHDPMDMMRRLRKRQLRFYEYLMRKNSKFEKYRRGWTRRAMS